MNLNLKIVLGVLLLLMGIINPIAAAPVPPTPQQVYQRCSQDLGRCIKLHKPTQKTYAKVMDICWQQTTRCPEVCVDEYQDGDECAGC
ncbi:MAG: hypothetical protein GXP51_11815 [Deltaproteobacteria bacterium]|nr:hypothetical protein [Deltaproteobacteria bacterium]